VVVVDYGIGNVFSVCQAITEAGGDPVLTADSNAIAHAERLVLPGVGAFGRAADELRRLGHDDATREFVATGRPFLGLCVGMQLLFDSSSENGEYQGLGLIHGTVERIPTRTADGRRLRVPHIGWAELQPPATEPRGWSDGILADVTPRSSAFYFVHSFAVRPQDPGDVLAVAVHGDHEIVAAVDHENMSGTQFHPERSGVAGQKVLRRFLGS
jgi:glutamine amidotransferase